MPLPAFVLPALLGATAGAGIQAISSNNRGGGFSQVANRFGRLEKPLTQFFEEGPFAVGKKGPLFPGGSEAAVAPLSLQEDQSFDFLRKFGEGDFGKTFQNANSQINQTLTNQFDPTTSPYYQAVKAESARNLEDTQREIDNQRGGGRFFTGARVAEKGRAATESKNNLDVILGALADKERDRSLSVIPQALQFEQARLAQPLAKAAAFQDLGALPRIIDQAGRDFDVSQFQQSEIDFPLKIASMVSGLLTGNQPVLQENPPSPISQLLGGVGQTAGNAGTTLLLAKAFGLL